MDGSGGINDKPPVDVSEGLCRVLAPSIGLVIPGAPVATPEAIPWGYQAGVGATISIDLTYRGDKYLFTVSPDGALKTTVSRHNGGENSIVNSPGAMRVALEAMENAMEVIDADRRKFLSSPARRHKRASQAPPDTPAEDW